MKQSVNNSDFHTAFNQMGRGDQFSYDALSALFDHLKELERDLGEEEELDVIALCCDFCEHESASECIEDMGYGFKPEASDPEEVDDECLEYLREKTQVITFEGGIIIQQF